MISPKTDLDSSNTDNRHSSFLDASHFDTDNSNKSLQKMIMNVRASKKYKKVTRDRSRKIDKSTNQDALQQSRNTKDLFSISYKNIPLQKSRKLNKNSFNDSVLIKGSHQDSLISLNLKLLKKNMKLVKQNKNLFSKLKNIDVLFDSLVKTTIFKNSVILEKIDILPNKNTESVLTKAEAIIEALNNQKEEMSAIINNKNTEIWSLKSTINNCKCSTVIRESQNNQSDDMTNNYSLHGNRNPQNVSNKKLG